MWLQLEILLITPTQTPIAKKTDDDDDLLRDKQH